MPEKERFYQDVYEVSCTDTERPLGKYWDTPMKRNVLLRACGNKLFSRGKIFEQLRLVFLNKTVKAALCTKRTTLLNGKNRTLRNDGRRTSLMMTAPTWQKILQQFYRT
jgi:hypothetical protein